MSVCNTPNKVRRRASFNVMPDIKNSKAESPFKMMLDQAINEMNAEGFDTREKDDNKPCLETTEKKPVQRTQNKNIPVIKININKAEESPSKKDKKDNETFSSSESNESPEKNNNQSINKSKGEKRRASCLPVKTSGNLDAQKLFAANNEKDKKQESNIVEVKQLSPEKNKEESASDNTDVEEMQDQLDDKHESLNIKLESISNIVISPEKPTPTPQTNENRKSLINLSSSVKLTTGQSFSTYVKDKIRSTSNLNQNFNAMKEYAIKSRVPFSLREIPQTSTYQRQESTPVTTTVENIVSMRTPYFIPVKNTNNYETITSPVANNKPKGPNKNKTMNYTMITKLRATLNSNTNLNFKPLVNVKSPSHRNNTKAFFNQNFTPVNKPTNYEPEKLRKEVSLPKVSSTKDNGLQKKLIFTSPTNKIQNIINDVKSKNVNNTRSQYFSERSINVNEDSVKKNLNEQLYFQDKVKNDSQLINESEYYKLNRTPKVTGIVKKYSMQNLSHRNIPENVAPLSSNATYDNKFFKFRISNNKNMNKATTMTTIGETPKNTTSKTKFNTINSLRKSLNSPKNILLKIEKKRELTNQNSLTFTGKVASFRENKLHTVELV